MEDFSKVYTVEFYGAKGWEVERTFSGLNDAVRYFRQAVLNSYLPMRLTTPTVLELN